MPRERSHHYIPEFHLAQFIGLRYRRFLSYDKRYGKMGPRPVTTSATTRDYYTLRGDTDAARLRIEREFALLEDRVAPLIRRLATSPPGKVALRLDERDALAGYAAILHVRGPAHREASLARARAMAVDPAYMGLDDRVVFRRAARAMGIPGSDDELESLRIRWRDDVLAGRRGFSVHPTASLMGLTAAVTKVRPLLLGREWTILRSDDWPGFVLGDQPVTLRSGARIAPEIGFGTPGVEVMMPLSPRSLLLISDRAQERQLIVQREEPGRGLREPWWATVNRVAWLTAKRYVFGRHAGVLRATELLVDPRDRRRDLHDLSPEELRESLAASRRRRQRRPAEER